MADDQGREMLRKWNQLVAKCWSDEEFKAKFMADPAGVMAEAGLDVPEGHSFKVVENTCDMSHITLPARPEELSDEALGEVAGGQSCDRTVGTIGSVCIATAGTAYCH